MAALTGNKLNPHDRPMTFYKLPALAGTYYAGAVVYAHETGYIAELVSGSTIPGLDIAGFVTEKQVVAANGDTLEFYTGKKFMSGSGFTGALGELKQIVYVDDSNTAYASQGTNRLPAGVVETFFTGSGQAGVLVRNFGELSSGSVGL